MLRTERFDEGDSQKKSTRGKEARDGTLEILFDVNARGWEEDCVRLWKKLW